MSLDSILSQVTGGVSWQALTLSTILRGALTLIIGIIVVKILMKLVDRALNRSKAVVAVRGYIRSTVRVLLWSILAVMVLSALNVPVTSIIAVFSVAGLAVSLALQNTLSNLASGIVIMVSKPFVVGDYVEIDNVGGTVSTVGLVYSMLVPPENKEIYIPNSQVSAAKVINYTHLGHRRMELLFSASYDAPTETVKTALREVVEQFPQILSDPAPAIWLNAYKDSCIEYVVRVWTTPEDWSVMASKGVSAIPNPMSTLKLGSGIAPVPAMGKAGVNVCLGTDGVSSNNCTDFFGDMKLAAILHNGANCDPLALLPIDALRMATVNGGKALGRLTGRIEGGYDADLILVDFSHLNLTPCHSVISNLAYAAHGSDVCMNMARGKVIYRDGDFLTIDIDRVKREVADYALPLLFETK